MIDPPDLFSIDLSIKKKFEKKITTQDIKYLTQEAKLLIQKNYTRKKHVPVVLQGALDLKIVIFTS